MRPLRDKNTEKKVDGAQAIRRAAAILKHIAANPRPGATLRDISEAMELSRSTAHRILKCLVQENLVSQSDDGRRYSMGDLTLELGLAAKPLQKAILQWRRTVEEVSRQTGATTYLMGRSGDESVCLDTAAGSSVVRVLPVEVGQRRPLGLGAGAVAILAAMPEGERENTIDSIEPYLHLHSTVSAAAIREMVKKTRETGFAESWGQVAEGIFGLGVAIPSSHGTAMLALSVAAHQSVVSPEKIAAWKRLLLKAAQGEFGQA